MNSFTLREYESVSKDSQLLEDALKYHEMNPKKLEKEDFRLFSQLMLPNLHENEDFGGWFLGTDLLIVPDFDVVLNLEAGIINLDLKHENGNQKLAEIEKKFVAQNRMFRILNCKAINLVFLADSEKLLQYKDSIFTEVSFSRLAQFIRCNQIIYQNKLKDLDSQDYLIAPLQNIEKFLEGRYWLTEKQQSIVNNISTCGIYGIEGAAGTGKTLIAYDFIRRYGNQKKILLIFSGNLRKEHEKLASKFEKVEFISAKDVTEDILNEFEVVIVDESQRLHGWVRQIIAPWARTHSSDKSIVFLYDVNQALGPKDAGVLMSNLCRTFEKDGVGSVYKLRKGMRSNPYIEAFVRNVFSLDKKPTKDISLEKMKSRIDVRYFASAEMAIPWIQTQINNGYVFITPTGDNRNPASADQFMNLKSINTHEIIGGEIDKVVTYIDNAVKYNNKGKLVKVGTEYYFNDTECYVNMSRAKKKLKLAIIKSPDIYKAITEVVFGQKSN